MKIFGNIIFIISLPICLVMFIVSCIGVALDMGSEEYFKLYNHIPDSWGSWTRKILGSER